MRGPGPGTLTRSAETTAARLEALRRWIHHADPPAGLVALIDPATLAPACSLRRMSGNWVALALPPVVLRQLPPTPTAFSPAEDRRDALHDALYGLGLGHALLLPLRRLEFSPITPI